MNASSPGASSTSGRGRSRPGSRASPARSPGARGPEARPRAGPHPIGLHLARQAAVLASAPAALDLLAGEGGLWDAGLRGEAEALAEGIRRRGAPSVRGALAAEAAARHQEFLDGVAAYRAHPYRRGLPEAPCVWEEGTARLLDHGAGGAGPGVLLVPSLINRSHVLDLMEGRSLARHLAGLGMRPFLLDWGDPGPEEEGFDVECYVVHRLVPALGAAAREAGPVAVAGYCMGGLLALAAALRRPEEVLALALLATPWDFHADEGAASGLAAAMEALVPGDDPGTLDPVHLQGLFALLDAPRIGRKFREFGRRPAGGPGSDLFVAVEDWLNDGVPLALPAARDCFRSWYGRNLPARGEWEVDGAAVDPGAWEGPALVAVPARDRIVPPASAGPLAEAIPGAARIDVPSGHVGMVVGDRAREGLWRPLQEFVEGAAGGR